MVYKQQQVHISNSVGAEKTHPRSSGSCSQPQQTKRQSSCHVIPLKSPFISLVGLIQMDWRPSQRLSGDSTQQMVLRLTLLIIIMIAMIVTIIARGADDDCGHRRGYELQEPRMSASVRATT